MAISRFNEDEPLSEINVTPFVDVLLVLLVIFMITAPVITHALKVQLPEENLRSIEIKSNRKFVVSINRRGKIYLNKRKISLKKLLRSAQNWKSKKGNQTVFIRADRKVPYGKVTQVMAKLKNAGITNVGLLIEKEALVHK